MGTETCSADELRNIRTYYDAVDLLLDKGIIPAVYEPDPDAPVRDE